MATGFHALSRFEASDRRPPVATLQAPLFKHPAHKRAGRLRLGLHCARTEPCHCVVCVLPTTRRVCPLCALRQAVRIDAARQKAFRRRTELLVGPRLSAPAPAASPPPPAGAAWGLLTSGAHPPQPQPAAPPHAAHPAAFQGVELLSSLPDAVALPSVSSVLSLSSLAADAEAEMGVMDVQLRQPVRHLGAAAAALLLAVAERASATAPSASGGAKAPSASGGAIAPSASGGAKAPSANGGKGDGPLLMRRQVDLEAAQQARGKPNRTFKEIQEEDPVRDELRGIILEARKSGKDPFALIKARIEQKAREARGE